LNIDVAFVDREYNIFATADIIRGDIILIAICGIDGSGKSTQVKHLVEKFAPGTIVATRQPSD
jgi:ABC-type Mn2+/Zn2+ transport system ATPase subunit